MPCRANTARSIVVGYWRLSWLKPSRSRHTIWYRPIFLAIQSHEQRARAAAYRNYWSWSCWYERSLVSQAERLSPRSRVREAGTSRWEVPELYLRGPAI